MSTWHLVSHLDSCGTAETRRLPSVRDPLLFVPGIETSHQTGLCACIFGRHLLRAAPCDEGLVNYTGSLLGNALHVPQTRSVPMARVRHFLTCCPTHIVLQAFLSGSKVRSPECQERAICHSRATHERHFHLRPLFSVLCEHCESPGLTCVWQWRVLLNRS